MTGMIIEWAPFRLKEGVTEAELLSRSEALQSEFLAHQDGFVRRELVRGRDGGWVDLVYWRDEAAAESVMRTAMESPTCHRYFALMDGADHADPGAGVLHFGILKSYAPELTPMDR
jgi:hypothetical protein